MGLPILTPLEGLPSTVPWKEAAAMLERIQNMAHAAVGIDPTTLYETKPLAGEKKDMASAHILYITDKSVVAALPGEVII